MYCRAHKTATLTPIQHTVSPPHLVNVVIEWPQNINRCGVCQQSFRLHSTALHT